jgi:hypothetical protein
MAIKRTNKYVQACAFLARQYNRTVASVMAEQVPYSRIYAEMKGWKFGWSSAKGQWLPSAAIRHAAKGKVGGRQSASIRVSSYVNKDFAQSLADLIADFVEESGGTVSRTSNVIKNNNNSGGRVYLEVEI